MSSKTAVVTPPASIGSWVKVTPSPWRRSEHQAVLLGDVHAEGVLVEVAGDRQIVHREAGECVALAEHVCLLGRASERTPNQRTRARGPGPSGCVGDVRSLSGVAAVDQVIGAGEERGVVGGEEDDQVGHLFGRAQPLHGVHAGDELEGLFVEVLVQ